MNLLHTLKIGFLRFLMLSLLFSSFTIAQAQTNLTAEQAREVAINAANQAIPGLGQPSPRSRDGWTWSSLILNNIRDTALGCNLVQGTPFNDPIQVYVISLYYGDAATYVVHVATDGRVQLCDTKFPGIGPDDPDIPTPAAPVFDCQAVTNTVLATYPTPQIVGDGNFSLPAGTYALLGRNVENTWVLLNVPTAPPGTYWIPRVSVAASIGQDCPIVPIVADSPSDTSVVPVFNCVANVVNGTATYPTPALGTANYTLPGGPYSVLGRNLENTWLRVAVPVGINQNYWVPRTAVTSVTGADCENIPAFTQEGAGVGSPVTSDCTLSPRGDFANIRAAPTTEAAQVDQTQRGTSHPVLGRNEGETWYRIPQGWVVFSVVVLSGQCNNLPLADSSTDMESVQPVMGVDLGYVCDFNNTLYLVPRIRAGRATARVESGGLPNNLRQEPDTSAASVGSAQPGRTFDQVLFGPACNQGFVWWYVELDGVRGWTAESSGRDNDYFIEPIPGFEADPQLYTRTGASNALTRFSAPVRYLAFNPIDADRLAVVDAESSTVSVWDISRLAELPQFFAGNMLLGGIAYLPDGRLAVATEDGTIRITELASGEVSLDILNTLDIKFGLNFTISADGSLLAHGGCAQAGELQDCVSGQAVIYSLTEATFVRGIIGHDNAIYNVAFNTDVRFLATSSTDGVLMWNVDTGDLLRSFPTEAFVEAMAFDPDSRFLAVASCAEPVLRDGFLVCELPEIRIWDIVSASTEQVISPPSEIYALAFSPDGSRLAYGGLDGDIYLWDIAAQEVVSVFEGHSGPVNVLAFNADGTLLVSGSDDQTVRLWRIESMEQESFG